MKRLKYIMLLSLTVILWWTTLTAGNIPWWCLASLHRKEASMSNSNGVISAPVNIESDIYKVLGIGPQGGWYDTAYACLNEHGKINPYAKYKPVKWELPDVNLKVNDNWKGKDGLCGFDVPVYTSIGELTSGMLAGNTFSYSPPVLGVDFFRFNDFDGYNHHVTQGFFMAPRLKGTVQVLPDKTVYLEVIAIGDPTEPASRDYVSFVDLSPVNPLTGVRIDANDMYVGVLFHRSSEQFTVVSDEKFGAMSDIIGFSIPISQSDMNKEWTYYVFLCASRTFDIDTTFIPTDIKPTRVTFIAYGTQVNHYLSIRDIENENGLFTIVYENKSGASVTYNGITAHLYDGVTGEELTYETVQGAFTLANNGTKTIDFSLFFDFDGYQNPDWETEYRLEVIGTASYGGGDLVDEVLFERYPDGTWIQL